MALLLDSWISEFILVVSVVTLVIYLWFDHGFKYWKKKGVPFVEPSIPFGNFRKNILGQEPLGVTTQSLYKQLSGERYVGHFGFSRPILLIRDPEIIRHILVKDFSTFHDRGIVLDDKEPLNHHLFALTGQKWRQLRVKLSPTFTSGKLKGMFTTLSECGREMADVLEAVAERGDTVEVRELAARYSTDIIASVAFGIECNCQRNPDSEFRQWGRRIFKPTIQSGISSILAFISPTLTRLLRIKGGTAAVSEYFRRMVADTVAYREKNNITRKDFMDLLIQLKNKGVVDPDNFAELTLNELAAQAFVFFVGGFETSSTTMSFALHELALNPSLQTKLQEEIDSVFKEYGTDITYDSISKMSYLDKVVCETLRKYPPLPILNRECNKEYRIPGSDLVLEKGTAVAISVLGLQHDPKYFPDPERFDPERFSEEEKAKRHPYVYLPFGEGPRICIGMRLGLLQVKVGLAYLLSRHNVRTTDKTVTNLEYNPRSIILMPKGGIQLRLEKRF
ncbi:cytochrome P450 6k1-like [Schistocerca serialis cubense]|uniref:cytochrome P450 6k1-like n=1 Tax=Schistocerca serialis cubense TaxID=2023355 RepID=UPI00214DFDD1|nr:cytochrome P450 6k1-like [Schistocerca serialis cubense]